MSLNNPQPYVFGAANIWIAQAGQALLQLGYTANGARISSQALKINIPTDERGGDEGLPGDMQMMGEIHRVRLEMSKWVLEVAAIMLPLLAGGTSGLQYPNQNAQFWPGDLVFANNAFYRLCIKGLSGIIRNYPCATLLEDPYEINEGTRWSLWTCNFLCYPHPTTGVLFDATG